MCLHDVCYVILQRVGLVDGFFVTAVFESNQTVRGIRCKGANYPGFIPRPLLSELPLQPLFMQSLTEKSQMDANLFTWLTLHVENAEKRLKETALKSFVVSNMRFLKPTGVMRHFHSFLVRTIWNRGLLN